MHAKSTDSEGTSLAASSPTRSSPPRHPAIYYVQSPSRDSHDDGETNKTTITATNSFGSTPVLSPMGSPPHSHSSLGPTSRDSSSTRFSGSLKPAGSRKMLDNDDGPGGRRKGMRKPWKQFDAIEEEGLLGEDELRGGLPRRWCYFLSFVVGFVLLFSLFSLILLGASTSQKPVITMKSIAFDSFVIQAGTDGSGVATDMVSMNSTVKFTFHNTATFFGVHVTSTPLSLSFSQLTLSSGTINKFYQSRKRQRLVTVEVKGSKVPIYGVAASLTSSGSTVIEPVPLTLNFMVRSRAYVLGKLVKPKFYKRIECNVVMDPKKMNVAISLKKLCTYQ